MKFAIKHRFTGAVLFTADLGAEFEGASDSVKLGAAVKIAVKARADLARAYLARAYLADANLAGADLAGADLTDAKLRAKGGLDLVLVGERPCLQIGPIGSRHDHMAAFITDAGVYVRAGCFWGTLDAFRRAVAETHGGGRHAREYHSAIALVEMHAELWTPTPPEPAPAEPAEVQS